jgi:hypothetical protein
MTDTSQNSATESRKKREEVSIKEYLAADGSVIEGSDSITKATGLRYTALPDKKTFDMQLPGVTAGSPVTMFALFGLSTRCTILATQNRNKSIRERFASDASAVESAWTNTRQGVWGGAEKTADFATLWLALVEANGSEPAMGKDAWIAKVVASPELAESFLAHKVIGAIYERMLRDAMGAGEDAPEAIGDLLAGMGA